jgi:protein-S-isoprenylcysteine O-methyltransferase Ste14
MGTCWGYLNGKLEQIRFRAVETIPKEQWILHFQEGSHLMDNRTVEPILTLLLGALLLGIAYAVFRIIVKRDYSEKGQLGWFASGLELLVFVGFFMFPYTFNPPEWPWFWSSLNSLNRLAGFIVILLGIVLAFGTMAWFGLGRALGRRADQLIKLGPYRWSRNPQLLGGYLLVIGTALQWPSLYSLIWIGMYGLIGHWMIRSEEEFLAAKFGDDYPKYCRAVPRYFLRR